MENVVGIFATAGQAYEVLVGLQSIGVPPDKINILLPGSIPIERVPVSETEQPGTGTAIGAVVGGATGAFAGLSIVALTLPAIGVVTAVGLAAAITAGFIGGAAAGHALEGLANGLPIDEVYLYEDALRQGRSVVVVQASDLADADRVRDVFACAGAESIDAAREQWWTGLRSAEKAHYHADGGSFDTDETEYRRGFEASLHLATRGKSYAQATPTLRVLFPHEYNDRAFRQGYERGREYRDRLAAK